MDCLFEILQKKDLSEVGNMVRMEMYLINTCNLKRVKIRKQAARDGVQFNFVPPEGVSSSGTPLGNTGESMAVGPERTDQFSPKSYVLFKPFKGLSPIGVKKDGLNLPACNFGGQRLVSHSPNVIPAEPTPPKGPPPVKKSHEAIPNNFKVLSSTTKGSAVQRSSSVGPVKCDATTLIKTSLFSPIRTKTTSKIKTISGSNKQVSGTSVPPILPVWQSQTQSKKKGTWPSVNINSNPVVPSFKSASSQPKEIVGKSRNGVDSLIQKKENRRSQLVSSSAPVFINKEDLPVENALMEEPNNRREVKSMLKKLNLNIEWASATKDFRRVYEGLENGSIFPEDKKLRCQAFYLVGYLVKTGCTKRKKGRSEEVINLRVGWEKGKNESEEEKEKVSQKKRRITQEKESGERKLVNLPNEEGVGIVHLLMEKPKERSGGV